MYTMGFTFVTKLQSSTLLRSMPHYFVVDKRLRNKIIELEKCILRTLSMIQCKCVVCTVVLSGIFLILHAF